MCFTVAETKMLKDALLAFERALQRQDKCLPNMELTAEVVLSLKGKLNRLLQKEGWSEEVPFDCNEIFLLFSGLHMHLLELKRSRNQKLISQCVSLCARFLTMSEIAHSVTVEHTHRGNSPRLT
jgi:hypothetical protein